MKIKEALKIFCASFLFVCMAFLSGCNSINTADSILTPPKTSADFSEIKSVLNKSVSEKFTLKYPSAGKYRSAYILADLMSIGNKNFALAFYSTVNKENVITMHMHLMKKIDEKWTSLSDTTVSASDVEKVEFSDFDADGIYEIVVGWNIYGEVDKTLMVYSLSGNSLTPRTQEAYTNFECFDLKGQGKDELFIIKQNQKEGTALVKTCSFTQSGVVEGGNCAIDGTVSSFYDPVISKIAGGIPAVFIDAVKGTGVQTEIVYYKNGVLTAPTFNGSPGKSVTYRETTNLITDIDGDGYMDIPMAEYYGDNNIVLTENQKETYTNNSSLSLKSGVISSTGLTKWESYNGIGFTVTLVAFMNYSDGYYFEIPLRWVNNVRITKNSKENAYSVNLNRNKDNESPARLVDICTVSKSEWDESQNTKYKGYMIITKRDDTVWAAKISDYSGPEKIEISEVKKLFHFIKKAH